jgi:hypothetical protein
VEDWRSSAVMDADCMSLFRDTRMQGKDSLKKLPRQVVLF